MEFKAFLSHRYRSPEVNLYFHELFTETAQIQFEVDIGSLPTNVTRLERMIREADAFIGIYPFQGDPRVTAKKTELQNASKYFRLECDLAVRSGKPALVLLDKRYASHFDLPPMVRSEYFDIQEVTGKGGKPNTAKFRRIFRDFCDELRAVMAVSVARQRQFELLRVGIIVPTEGPGNSKYSLGEISAIKETLIANGVKSIEEFPWPPIIHQRYMAQIETLDFVLIDIGYTAMKSGIVGYLHGRSIPTLRLNKTKSSRNQMKASKYFKSLFGGVEVGYPKDIVIWNDANVLKKELHQRLLVLNAPAERIGTPDHAEIYFRKASQRKEAVFLSYSGLDSELASKISKELKKRFQQVFDYKDGESITPGEPWMKEIFDKLSVATLGVPLVSSDYFESGNCEHEAFEMVAKRDEGGMSMIPLKLYNDDRFPPPSWMRSRQYMHYYDYPDVVVVVDKLIEFFDRTKVKNNPWCIC